MLAYSSSTAGIEAASQYRLFLILLVYRVRRLVGEAIVAPCCELGDQRSKHHRASRSRTLLLPGSSWRYRGLASILAVVQSAMLGEYGKHRGRPAIDRTASSIPDRVVDAN